MFVMTESKKSAPRLWRNLVPISPPHLPDHPRCFDEAIATCYEILKARCESERTFLRWMSLLNMSRNTCTYAKGSQLSRGNLRSACLDAKTFCSYLRIVRSHWKTRKALYALVSGWQFMWSRVWIEEVRDNRVGASSQTKGEKEILRCENPSSATQGPDFEMLGKCCGVRALCLHTLIENP